MRGVALFCLSPLLRQETSDLLPSYVQLAHLARTTTHDRKKSHIPKWTETPIPASLPMHTQRIMKQTGPWHPRLFYSLFQRGSGHWESWELGQQACLPVNESSDKAKAVVCLSLTGAREALGKEGLEARPVTGPSRPRCSPPCFLAQLEARRQKW